MSKLAAMLTWTQTGQVKPIEQSLAPVMDTQADWIYHKPTGVNEHRLAVRLGVSVFLTDVEAAATRDASVLAEAITKNARMQIVEAVFGEFRETINGIEPQTLRDSNRLRQMVARDFEQIQAAVGDLLVDRPRRNILRRGGVGGAA